MVKAWIQEELRGVALHDQRLNRRLGEVLWQLGGRPTASIPAACGGYAETAAAYRLFDNDKVCFDNVLLPHREATRRRVAAQSTVIVAQDTTEIDLTRPGEQVEGVGPLDGGARWGLLLHVLHAFTPDGTPLGTLWARPWARSAAAAADRKHMPIEAKESQRWLDGLERACVEAARAPQTHVVCVADSEADIYELLAAADSAPPGVDWIVRACQNRAVRGVDGDAPPTSETASRLREQVLATAPRFMHTISVRGRKAKVACEHRGRRQPRHSRKVPVAVYARTVTLRPPWRPDRTLAPVTVNVVAVVEVDPPAGDVGVEWLLLTSLPIAEVEQIRRVVATYCTRWLVEIVFRVLKSGCRVEDRRFTHVDRVRPCLAVYLIVAWRSLYVCRLGRAAPEMSCEAVFDPAEWQSLWRVVRRSPPPALPPPLQEVVRLVAQLGGYVNRKRPDEPGPQTVWLGLQRLQDIALCWKLFGPPATENGTLV